MSRSSLQNLIFSLVVIVAILGAMMTVLPSDTGPQQKDPARLSLEQPHENSSYIWPYTSRYESVDGRTIEINLIFVGDPERIRYQLTEQRDATWNETEEEWDDVDPEAQGDEFNASVEFNGTIRAWDTAAGATRFVYVSDDLPEGSGQWITESYQLHDGDYFGTRYHIRAYESPYEGDNWTAVQAHDEYWDWFRLRHTVGSTDRAQTYVESEFMDEWFVEDVRRVHFGNDDTADSDGWATVIRLRDVPTPPIEAVSLVALLFGFDRRREDGSVRDEMSERFRNGLESVDHNLVAVFCGLISIYLFVRIGGILAEYYAPVESPKVIAMTLYPVLAVGLPICAYVFGRRLDTVPSFAGATGGLMVAFLIDYAYLNIVVLPIDVLIHRTIVALAIGFIAAGAVSQKRFPSGDRRHLRTGIMLWIVALTLPLVRWL